MKSIATSNPAPEDDADDGERSADEHHAPGKDTEGDEALSFFRAVAGVISKDNEDQDQDHSERQKKRRSGRSGRSGRSVTIEDPEDRPKKSHNAQETKNIKREDKLRAYADSLAELFHDRGEEEANDVMEYLVHANEGKRLFVCCDGTWNNASGTAAPMTNVAKLSRAVYRVGEGDFCTPKELEPSMGPMQEKHRYGLFRQIVYYSSGVGSQSSLAVDSLFSGAFGKGIDANILSAYCFLCNNYNGVSHMDEIILVGFSRGAFTARCLAHFINKVGLLRRKGLVFLQSVYSAWQRSSEGLKGASEHLDNELEALKTLRMYPIRIHVLAEWDTVSAVRSLRPGKKRLAFVHNEVPPNVKHVFHAVSLHEKRRNFKPLLWEKARADTTVEQCAFVGCHSDIGGGNTDPGLSTVSLLWMVSRICDVSKAKFDSEMLFPSIVPLKSRKPVNFFNPLTWGKSEMHLNNLITTPGQINESQRGLWLLLYFITLGGLRGKRDKFIQKFAQSRKAKKDAGNKHGIRVKLKPLQTLENVLERISKTLPKDAKRKYDFMDKDMTNAWSWASPVQKQLQFATSVLTELKWDMPVDEFSELWLAQQEVRRTWLKLEMQGDVGLQIHFTARLLHSQLNSDSRLKCGLFRHFEPNGHTQEWLEKSSKVLSLAEASVLRVEMKLLGEWIKASRELGQKEGSNDVMIQGEEETDWTAIQLGFEKIDWGKYVPGCTYYSSLTGLMDREFERLRVSPPNRL